jgi:hypothetical protein
MSTRRTAMFASSTRHRPRSATRWRKLFCDAYRCLDARLVHHAPQAQYDYDANDNLTATRVGRTLANECYGYAAVTPH